MQMEWVIYINACIETQMFNLKLYSDQEQYSKPCFFLFFQEPKKINVPETPTGLFVA